ncbi:MAG: hypothetical protein ACYDEJ_15550 [Desulfitobacteriaceae bacterium]
MPSKLYKLVFDISICFTIGAFLLNYFGAISINGGGFLILIIASLISTLLGQKRKLKIITTILIPVVYFAFFLPTIPELVVFLLIWVYYSYISIREDIVIGRGEFIDMIKRSLYSCLILPFLMLTAFHKFGTAIETASPYLIVALLSAVFLLRYLRADNQMGQMKRYRRQQFMELMAFLIISLLLTLARAPQNLVEGLKQMYQHLLVPILSFLTGIIGMLIGGIIYLVLAAGSVLTKNSKVEEAKIKLGETMQQSLEITDAKAAGADWVLPLIYSLGAIVGLVLLFFFFRWLMGEKMKQKMPVGILETREYLVDVKDKGAAFRKRCPKDSRAAVRYYYGKCLLWMQHKRVQLKPQDTTEEINNKYYNLGHVKGLAGATSLQSDDFEAKRGPSAELKQLYRKARYQVTEEITKEEAEKAKQLYQRMKATKNL